jgi:predicted  nucleic acid-binding Zn-ribbon protein
MNNRSMKKRYLLLAIFICAGISLTAKYYHTNAANNSDSSAPQDVINLDRRINALEQRFFTVETRINRLEQQSMTSSRSTAPPAPTMRDPEVESLRGEVESLKARVRELECAVVHLDERTLPVSAKENQKRAGGQSQDPCRLNSQTPVRLSMRP